jgi:polyphosphate glucokinase
MVRNTERNRNLLTVSSEAGSTVKILVIDVGGTNVKILASGQPTRRKFPSGPTLTPSQMVSTVKKIADDWEYDAISIGYPGRVLRGRPASEPRNLGPGWVGFDFAEAFECPVKLMNDAAMQALGSYKGGTMLFLGLGTGLGAALVVDHVVVPMEWGHFSYKNSTVEDYMGARGLRQLGKKRWKRHVRYGLRRMFEVFSADDIVIGGGNAKKFKDLPAGCRAGDNANAFLGGFRMWEEGSGRKPSSSATDTFDIAASRKQPKEVRKGRSS